MFDYEKQIYDLLMKKNGDDKDKHIWILKAAGLGITELILRIICWLATRNDDLKGSQVCIVTGPRIDLATTLIERIKKIFPEHVTFDSKSTVVILNDVVIEAFPSHHLDAMRGLPNVSFIFADECAFFPLQEQENVRVVTERYIGKSNPYIVLCSTPNTPFDAFALIGEEQQSIYHRVRLPYTVGLNKIYTDQDIARAKQSPSWQREFCCQFSGELGNCFAPEDLDKAVEMGKTVDTYNPSTQDLAMGIDPGFGSSKFGIVISQAYHSRIEIVYAQEFETSRPTRMLEVATELCSQFRVDTIFVDGSNPGVISDLKERMGEDFRKESWERDLLKAKKIGANPRDYMKVIPIVFTRERAAEMLTHMQRLVSSGYLAVPEQFKELVVQMRIATATEGRLDKSQYSLDLIDATRLNLQHYKIKKR